jgi:hypothetical protein
MYICSNIAKRIPLYMDDKTRVVIIIALLVVFFGCLGVLKLADWRNSLLLQERLTPLSTPVPPTEEPVALRVDRSTQFAVCKNEVNKAYKIKNIKWPEKLSNRKPCDYYYIVATHQGAAWTFKGQIQAIYTKSNGVAVVSVDCQVSNGKMLRFVLDPATPKAGDPS